MFSLRTLSFPVLLAALLISAGCDKKFADDSKVLASVNGENITQLDFENYLQLRSAQQGPIGDDEQQKKLVLNEMIDRLLLTQHGTALGLDKKPEVHFRLKRARENMVTQEVVRNTIKDVQISDEDVKKRVTQDLENANKTEYKVRHILVKTEDEVKKAADEIKAGKKFEQVARTSSIDTESGKRGGELGAWINQNSGLVPEFFNALTKLTKGQTSDPIKSDFGWHLIKVDDTRPFKLPTVEQVLSDPRAGMGVRRRMQEEKLQTMLKDLKDKAKVVIN